MSLPTGERGLKSHGFEPTLYVDRVAPHGGAWIEIITNRRINSIYSVAPHGGAWIEIGQ